MADCARAILVETGPAIAAMAAVSIVLRSIMAPSGLQQDNPTGERAPLNKPLWPLPGRGAPRQWEQRHVMPVPLANRVRPLAHEGVFDRLGLADGDMQRKQRHGDGIGPLVEAQIAKGLEQHRA